MTRAGTPKRSRRSTENGAYTSDSAPQARTEERGASRAAELTTLARYNADTSRAGDTGPHGGTQTTPSPNARPATYSTKAPSGYSDATSTPSSPVWPKQYTTAAGSKPSSSPKTSSSEPSSSSTATENSSRPTRNATPSNSWSISPRVHDWMRANVNPDARVLELGGGYASPELHAAFPNAITVEHDERWTRYLRSKGLRVIHAPLEQGWYQAGPELTAALQTADVVLIDGPPGLLRINGHRHTHHIPPGTVVIHDDTQRHYIREAITDPVIATITDRERTTTVTRKSPARA